MTNTAWHDPFLKLLREGKPMNYAAKAVGIARNTAYNHQAADPEFAAACTEATTEGFANRQDLVDQKVEEWALDIDAPPVMRIFWAKRWNHAYRDNQKVEVTGPAGGPVQLEHRGVKLSDVIRVARDAGVEPGD